LRDKVSVALVVLAALLACKSGDEEKPKASQEKVTAKQEPATAAQEQSPAASSAPALPAASAAASAETPSFDYPTDGLKTIADSCTKAAAILASVPRKVVEGWQDGHEWNWAVQALLAHGRFSLRDDVTSQSMEVKFLQYQQPNDAVALVAHCHDGITCNKLAAMYKFTVPGARPQLFCGANIPSIRGVGATVVKLTPFGGDAHKLPDAKNVIGRCARLHICSRKLDRSSADDMGLQCQRAPGKFKTSCVAKRSCPEVVACAKG
jgi:hypothetical protein